MSDAYLLGADLSDADLGYTTLIRANLSDARNLTLEQLNKACGDKNPKLGDDLKDLILNPCQR